ncbi:hypothetical protein SB861_25510 [Paraburkholderia sp. SIMBA_049]
MYDAGLSIEKIQAAKNLSYQEVRRLLKRCYEHKAVGMIWGFEALLPGKHIKQYKRNASSSERDEKKVRAEAAAGNFTGELGFAGVLDQLLYRCPAVEEALLSDIRKKLSIKEVHKNFLDAARASGVSVHEWPFNTQRQGYNAIAGFAKHFRGHDSRAYVAGYGLQAAQNRRLDPAGERTLPDLRCMARVQLDYHKVDAASIITCEINGVEHELSVPRWYVGILAEVYSSAILGLTIALELNPSSLSFLETISSALFGIEHSMSASISEDGNHVLINSFLPEAKDCCFSLLEIDNAWANLARDSINNVIGITGCAIRVGKPYEWWGRSMVENLIGRLTAKGAKKLQTTFGSGPNDPMRADPIGKAFSLHFTIDELIETVFKAAAEINVVPSTTNNGNSPLQVIKAAFEHPSSGVFPQPLPKSDLPDWLLLSTVKECTVVGDPSKGRACYINLLECRFTHKRLTATYDLFGEKLIVYVNKKDANQVFAVVKKTGEKIGLLIPEHAKRREHVTIAERKRLNKFRKSRQAVDDAQTAAQRVAETRKPPPTGDQPESANVLQLAASRLRAFGKAEKAPKETTRTPLADELPVASTTPNLGADPFGLRPRISSLKRGR